MEHSYHTQIISHHGILSQARWNFVYCICGHGIYSPKEVTTGRTVGPSYQKIPQLNLTCEYEYNAYVQVDKNDEVFKDDVNENPFIR